AAESTPDWMNSMSNLGLGADEPAQAQPTEAGFDWMGSMDTLISETATTEAPAEPAAESTPDWMGRMSDLGLGADEPAQAQPSEAGFDWMGSMDTLMSESPTTEAPAEPAAESTPDWMGRMSDLGFGAEEPAQAQSADTSLDWLSGTSD